MKELQDRAVKLTQMLDAHVAAMTQEDPALARNIAFDMMQVVNGLYNAAYALAAAKARKEGRIG